MALNDPYTPGLDRNKEMQKQPLGTFSALRRPSPVASQYKRQAEMYGQALRTLSRAARRGDSDAAIKAIGIRNHAMDNGYSPGGIGRSEDRQSAIQDQEQRMMRDNETLQRADQVNRGALDRRLSGLGGGATEGAGRGTPLSRNVNGPSQGNEPNGPAEVAGPPSYLKNTRISAALDILEGDRDGGDIDQYERGYRAAQSLGVENPNSVLKGGDRNLKYRQTLDSALGQAKSPEEIAALKERGMKNGITAAAFDRRAKWWETNRS